VISAHWLTEGAFVHVGGKPRTIHDFWGFPKEMYDLRYACPGAPERAGETGRLTGAVPDAEWGLDHGAWSVLRRMYPEADVPVFQLSIDTARSSAQHYELGRALAPLRERGVLIVGSGNIVHNLGIMQFDPGTKPFDWAMEYDAAVADALQRGDHRGLVEHESLGSTHAARLSVPTPDHWWPLLYAAGAAAGTGKGAEVSEFLTPQVVHGSVGMRAVIWK
jgi:4,5-DOPA dioxygenase extradiol